MRTVAEQILEDVEIASLYQQATGSAIFDQNDGFLTLPEHQPFITKRVGETAVLAFFNSGWQSGDPDSVSLHFRNYTQLRSIPEKFKTLDRQGRGTGARGYNTWQAAAGAAEDLQEVGLYAFALNFENLTDRCRGDARQYLNSLAIRCAALALGKEEVIQAVNRQTQSYDAVVYNQPTDGKRQKALKSVGDSVVPERLMVIRRPMVFTRIGVHKY